MAKSTRHRRSVALLPDVKENIERIADARGVSLNRAIEDAVKLYSHCVAQSGRGIVSVTIRGPNANGKEFTYLL